MNYSSPKAELYFRFLDISNMPRPQRATGFLSETGLDQARAERIARTGSELELNDARFKLRAP